MKEAELPVRVKQLSVFLENRKGSLAAMAQLLGSSGINMLALSIAETDNFGICRLIVSNAEEGVRILRAAGYTVRITEVLVVCVPDRPNGLAEVLRMMEHEDISVEYLYSFVRNSGYNALIIFRLSDIGRAERLCEEKGVKTLSKDEVEAL